MVQFFLAKLKKFVGTINTKREDTCITEMFNRISNAQKIIGVIAYMLRFYTRTRRLEAHHISNTISATEFDVAFLKIIEYIQRKEFQTEREALTNNKYLKSFLQDLTPYLHEKTHNHFKLNESWQTADKRCTTI